MLQNELIVAAETRKKTCHWADANNFMGYERKFQVGSQSGWRCGLSKYNQSCDSAAVLCGQARELLGSKLIFCKEETGTEKSPICLGYF